MTEPREVTCRPEARRALWSSVAIGAAGAGAAGAWTAYRGPDPLSLSFGTALALIAVVALHVVTARVDADAHGLRSRTLLRRWSASWDEIADLRIRLRHASGSRGGQSRHVSVLLRNGRRRTLPLPIGRAQELPQFEAELTALRALHHHYGTDVPPESSRVPVIADHSAGRVPVAAFAWCVALLVCAGVAAAFVSGTAADQRAWDAARPCTAATPVAQHGECLSHSSTVIARTDRNTPKKTSWVYFADDRPFERLAVPVEAADNFRAGDKVQLTFWRGEVRTITGAHYVWHRHVQSAGGLAALASLAAVAAGYPAALLLLTLRNRRLPDDEVLPSALPFAFALAGTAAWLLPLCYLHPTTLFASATTIAWAAAGTLTTLALLTWAWRATRVRSPRQPEVPQEAADLADQPDEVFVRARFLDHTDYNPHGFGTHIALGDGPPAVTPGPDRFAARRIPVDRLTVRTVRRVRGADGDTVPGDWHIAELDDGGRLVRLAAAPDDLARVLRELRPAVREPS